MKVKLKIHRDDTVKVIAGKNKGRIGKVVAVMPQEQRVIVEGVNLVKRHVKPQQDRPGTIIEKEASIAISNVALWDSLRGVTGEGCVGEALTRQVPARLQHNGSCGRWLTIRSWSPGSVEMR